MQMKALREGSASKEAALGAASALEATSLVMSARLAAALRRAEEAAQMTNSVADSSIAERERATDAALAEAVCSGVNCSRVRSSLERFHGGCIQRRGWSRTCLS